MIVTTIARRIGEISTSVEQNLRANEFLAIARALACTRTLGQAEQFLRSRPVSDRVLEAFNQRAAVPGGLSTDSTWAAPLSQYSLSSDAFAEGLRAVGVFDRCLQDGSFLRVPPMTQVSVVSAGASASTVGESAPKPATQLGFTSVQLTMSKVSAFVVISAELMRMSGPGPMALLGRELRGAVAQQTDSYFLTQLLTGLTAIPSSGGASAVAVRTDLRYLMDAVFIRADAKLYYVTTAQVGKRLSVLGDSAGGRAFPGVTPTGGLLDGVPLLISDAQSSGVLTLFDASQVAVAAGDIELDRASAANLQMDTAPDSPPTASSPYINLWTQNMSALRAERFISAQRMRTAAAASISGFTGIGNSPS
jgi:hypothetical protein